MAHFSLMHEIECDVDTFWSLLFDREFNEALYLQGLGFPRYEIVETRDSETEFWRRVSVTPKMDLPAAVSKVVGSSFSFVEEGTFDKKAKVYRFKSTPSVLADKLKTEGRVRTEPMDGGRTRRFAEFDYEAKVFGVGGMIEAALEKNLRAGWDRGAAFMNEYLRRKKS